MMQPQSFPFQTHLLEVSGVIDNDLKILYPILLARNNFLSAYRILIRFCYKVLVSVQNSATPAFHQRKTIASA